MHGQRIRRGIGETADTSRFAGETRLKEHHRRDPTGSGKVVGSEPTAGTGHTVYGYWMPQTASWFAVFRKNMRAVLESRSSGDRIYSRHPGCPLLLTTSGRNLSQLLACDPKPWLLARQHPSQIELGFVDTGVHAIWAALEEQINHASLGLPGRPQLTDRGGGRADRVDTGYGGGGRPESPAEAGERELLLLLH
jgi:hypothetical protein